ncbi:MAG TPA: PilZ domain-containing protein [Myxococcota bacterium]|nr:PilZ domain-containing protein [Myxococcota bacterium]
MRRLKQTFDSAAKLAAEFGRNIKMGGAQIRTEESFDAREFVEVEFVFSWRGESLIYEAEVVFCGGGQAAVQFRKPASELAADLAPYMGSPSGRAKVEARVAPAIFEDELGDRAEREPVYTQSPDPKAKTVLRTQRPDLRDPLDRVADRRGSARAVARVPARVSANHVSLEGHTRDLSDTGVLISADGSDLPLGKAVELELQHPESGERLAVSGRVSRHVETDGTVAAVGVEFEPPQGAAGVLRNFVSDVKRAEAKRAQSGISGRIEELGIANLIQMLGQSSPRGTLTAAHGSEEATIAFENGTLRYALLGSLRGVKALARALQWTNGTFSFAKHVDALTDEPAPMPLQSALLEAARQVDESVRAAPIDPKQRFRVERAAFAAAGELTKLEEAVLDLAGAGLTVRRMIDVIPDSDAAVHEAIRALLERGLLAPKS